MRRVESTNQARFVAAGSSLPTLDLLEGWGLGRGFFASFSHQKRDVFKVSPLCVDAWSQATLFGKQFYKDK
jgi:hypothetical protein